MDWALHRRGNDLGTFLRPHLGHFSLVPIAIYRVLFASAGLTHFAVYRVMVIAALFVSPLITLYNYWRYSAPTPSEQIGLVIGSFALAIPLNVLVERRFRRSQTTERSSDIAFLSINAAAAICMVAIAMSAKLDDGWPWRLRPASSNPGIMAALPAGCESISQLPCQHEEKADAKV